MALWVRKFASWFIVAALNVLQGIMMHRWELHQCLELFLAILTNFQSHVIVLLAEIKLRLVDFSSCHLEVSGLQSCVNVSLTVVVILVAAFRLDRLQNIISTMLLATQLIERLLLDYVWAVGDHAARRLQGAGFMWVFICRVDIVDLVHLLIVVLAGALWQFGKSLQAFLWCDHDGPTKLLTLVTVLLAYHISTTISSKSCWENSCRVKWASFKLVW